MISTATGLDIRTPASATSGLSQRHRGVRICRSGCLPALHGLVSIAIVGIGLGLLSTLSATETHAQDAAQKGLAIAKAAREADRGFGGYSATLGMTLRNRNGQESRRDMRIKTLEVKGDGNRVIFVFDNPKDVRGTAFLIHGHIETADDQWLYLPALKRVKRISSSNRSGSFMGSEFAYEDLTTLEVEKFSITYLRDEPCGSLTCTVTEWVSREKGSGYARQLFWHDTDTLRVWKVEYYDRKNAHLKTLTYGDYSRFGDFWRAATLNMVNHLTGKGTVLNWTDFDFETKLSEREFTQTALRRAR